MGGGRGRSRTQRRHFRDGRENVWKRTKLDGNNDNESAVADKKASSTHWQPFETQNAGFDIYYKEQGIVSAEEWDTFMKFLRKPLPAAFRINSSSQFSLDIKSKLENDFMKSLQTEGTESNEEEGIRPLPWYPNNLAWHSSFSRMQLRKNKALERFHEFLKLENEIGNITRQEAVSMVPPLFLDVHEDHFVLDMCAAPGSKTFQLLEMIHLEKGNRSLPSGMVIANDVDVQRCNLLIHQTKRMCTANLIVTNHEAQHFPSCHSKKNLEANAFERGITQLLFDRVLCDVPCSGDGTLRKAPDIWKKWGVGMANGLHSLQIQIAMRGLSLLKIGGRMVYSTCSMNPVENEAVVAEILRRCGGSVDLVDVSSELPQLVRRPGLKKWKVREKGNWFASYNDVPKHRRDGIIPSMFPSGESSIDTSDSAHNSSFREISDKSNDENPVNGSELTENHVTPTEDLVVEPQSFPLERCMRIVPHDQDTGAFFISVFHKLSPLPACKGKPIKPHEQLDSINVDGNSGESVDALREDINGMEVDTATVSDGQTSEAATCTDSTAVVHNEPFEASLETNEIKVSDETEAEEIQVSCETETSTEKVQKKKLQIQGKWRGVDPVVFFNDDSTVAGIKAFYGIGDSFPLIGHLVTRNSDTRHVKRIYYISDSVKDVLELNFLAGEQLKITSIGLKMFERQTSKEGADTSCAFRISSEGLPLLLPHITKQILHASPVDFKHLLQYKTIKFADFVDAEFGDKASKLVMGCCVVVLNEGGQKASDQAPEINSSTIAIGCWKGRSNIAVMVTAIDCQELLERLLPHTETEEEAPLQAEKSSDEIDVGARKVDDFETKEDA